MKSFLDLLLNLVKPTPRRGNSIGLVGCLLIFISIWLDTDTKALPRVILSVGCLVCALGLINHLIFLCTEEAKETIWGKGGLVKVAFMPAPWRGMKIFWLGLIITFFGSGLRWLGVPFVIFLFPIGFLIGIVGLSNHLRWMFKSLK
jgi:hypothetical protein